MAKKQNADDTLHIRCTKADKDRWEEQAALAPSGKFAPWVVATLNSGAHFDHWFYDGGGDYLHYAQECIEAAVKDISEINARHNANWEETNKLPRQEIINLSTELYRAQFAIRQLVAQAKDEGELLINRLMGGGYAEAVKAYRIFYAKHPKARPGGCFHFGVNHKALEIEKKHPEWSHTQVLEEAYRRVTT